ncbi:hypothetical protein ACNA6I_14100 [Rossellomorea sp. FS2]|uniref:hypothetical protein n=1 Tax=Rossellomorea sp. FS2 TaxID=3391447 RepID=UPI003A4DBFFE
MKDYLKEKYKEEFEIGEIQTFNLGFAAGELIQARANPISNNEMVFIVSRDSNNTNYEDSYSKLLEEKFVRNLFSENLSELSVNTKYYITTAYNGDLGGDGGKEIEINKLNPSFVISIPVERGYDKSDYTKKILNLIYSIEKEEVGYYRVRIEFVDNKNAGIIEEYINLSQKKLTQNELKERDFSEVKRQYERSIIDRFTYDSKDVDFKNSPHFIRSLLDKTYKER